MVPGTFSALSASQRAEGILDGGTFSALSGVASGLPLVVGSGRLGGMPVLVAFTDGHIHGGTVGVRESGVLARLAETAAAGQGRGRRPAALIIGFDTGGVRVQEGPVALAAASAVGVALARLSLQGVRLAAVISGPRGCFGAPAVMAALPDRVIMTEQAQWGLTGPKVLRDIAARARDAAPLRGQAAPDEEALAASSAANRLQNGDAQQVVADTAAAVRAALDEFIGAGQSGAAVRPLADRVTESAAVTAALQARLQADPAWRPPRSKAADRGRRRDLLRYSFRGQWQPTGAIQRRGLVQAALGTLAKHPALGVIVGPEQTRGSGVGIEEAAAVTEMVAGAVRQRGAQPAAILTFLFCQGHSVDCAQERLGLPRALAECLRAMAAARLLGHPIVSILGGGTYGAAYLALAAPSHRILAMRGTSVAPMAPEVLRAFEALRGHKATRHHGAQLAELIPDIRIVDSIIRLPRVLREELQQLRAQGEKLNA
jgi:acetyl-CoA carboxylase beta subunit